MGFVERRVGKVDRLPVLDVALRARRRVEENVIPSDLVRLVGVRRRDGESSVGLPPLKLSCEETGGRRTISSR